MITNIAEQMNEMAYIKEIVMKQFLMCVLFLSEPDNFCQDSMFFLIILGSNALKIAITLRENFLQIFGKLHVVYNSPGLLLNIKQ